MNTALSPSDGERAGVRGRPSVVHPTDSSLDSNSMAFMRPNSGFSAGIRPHLSGRTGHAAFQEPVSAHRRIAHSCHGRERPAVNINGKP